MLLVKKPVALTCSTEFMSSIHSIEWIVNGKHLWEDFKLLTESSPAPGFTTAIADSATPDSAIAASAIICILKGEVGFTACLTI